MIKLKHFTLAFPRPKSKFSDFFKVQNRFTALDNINVDFGKNDRVGLLGRNGAGKTTLLRAIGQVYKPTSGEIVVEGKVSTFFEIGTGLDINASGIRNIKRLMCIRGIRLEYFDDVLAFVESFSELGEMLHMPVRTYSSGQRMRLSIGVAIFQLNEIVLFDEMIGLGDKHFTTKVRNALKTKLASSHVFVIATHSESILKQFCTRGIVLDKGSIAFDGRIEKAINFFNNT